MKHVSLLAVIVLTAFNVVSVSAQKQVYGYGIPETVGNPDSIRALNARTVEHFIMLSRYYLRRNTDSAIYWADTAIVFASQRNDWQLINNAFQARRLILQYDLQKIKNDAAVLKTQNKFQQQYLVLLAVAGILIFALGIYLVILYRQKNTAVKELAELKAEANQKNTAFSQLEKEIQKQDNELVQLQNELKEKNNGSSNVNDIRDRLIPMIAHDIRSPLASLQNTLSLTRENILNHEEFQKLSLALEADIYNLRGMLDNMLLWAREQIVEIKIHESQFNLSEMAAEVILMYRNSLIRKDIHVHNYLQPGLQVYSDREMLSAILRNIFSNAVKFTEAGKNIYLRQEIRHQKVYITVKDEGRGITREVLKKINNKEHVSTRGTANEKGTGIGIVFTKELLDKLGEKFEITSIPEQGTSVTFSINIFDSLNPPGNHSDLANKT